jgi:murein DD-endopeptidase MepM/ murein hydrolase activator NlpD
VAKLSVSRLTLATVGLLLCSLPLTGTGLLDEPRPPSSADDEITLVSHRCSGFSTKDVLRGRRAHANGPTCPPTGLDGGIVRAPVANAAGRDRRNFGKRGVHSRRHHTGTDYRVRCGTPVHAVHTGKVIVMKPKSKRKKRKKGVTVGVSTGPSRLTTWYGPMKRVRVRNGTVVSGGQRLGAVARVKSGRKKRAKCFLHLGVHLRGGARDPRHANPSWWLKQNLGAHVSGLAPGKRAAGSFVVATLNVLGHRHTARGGSKRRQFAGSYHRMKLATSLLRSNEVDLVGLQELMGVQRTMFLNLTKQYRIYSPRDPQDSIAWRASRFQLLKATTFKIPYFESERPMPVVVLRDRATGRKLVVISVHNPANRNHIKKFRRKPWLMERRRAEAVRRELAVATKMRRATGAPVILMGDFNDRSRRLYCRVTKHGLKASSRGVRGRSCRPSVVAGIDWIFATRGIRFVGHQRVQGGLVAKATDHPLVLARAVR